MAQRKWLFLSVGGVGLCLYLLYQLTGGPRSISASESTSHTSLETYSEVLHQGMSEAEWRYRTGAAHHWRYVMLKR